MHSSQAFFFFNVGFLISSVIKKIVLWTDKKTNLLAWLEGCYILYLKLNFD